MTEEEIKVQETTTAEEAIKEKQEKKEEEEDNTYELEDEDFKLFEVCKLIKINFFKKI